ncbi:hypothetical protein RJ639_034034 [Escallonia herrerae]|uniref:Zinc finger, CCHC-type n=1 Tax=Escallonia herrerae TaxID=1293975 RepID=A0AA89BKR5_9ASTE|nr:hypothetical protein RJ639_034034 [Escallonia herrerae]
MELKGHRNSVGSPWLVSLEEWHKDNGTNHILSGMTDSFYDQYSKKSKSAKELWDTLKSVYQAEEASTKKFLVSNYMDFKMTDDRPVSVQVRELQLIANDICAAGMVLDENFHVGAIVAKLPPTWKEYRNKLKHKKEDLRRKQLSKLIIKDLGEADVILGIKIIRSQHGIIAYVLIIPKPFMEEAADEVIKPTAMKQKQKRVVHTLYDVYEIKYTNNTAKELLDDLDSKYKTEDAVNKKFLIIKLFDFRMGHSLDESFQVSTIISKLPLARKECRKELKQKKDFMTMQEFVKYIQVEENSRNLDRIELEDNKSSKALIVDHDSSSGSKRKLDGQAKEGDVLPERFKTDDDIIAAVVSENLDEITEVARFTTVAVDEDIECLNTDIGSKDK